MPNHGRGWESFATTLLPAVTSDAAFKTYAIAALIGALGLLFGSAYRHHAQLSQLQESLFEPQFRGRAPLRRGSIERRERLVEEIKDDRWRVIRSHILWLFVFGVAIPVGLFLLIATVYPWAGDGGAPLLYAATKRPDSNPAAIDIASFVAGQLIMGVVGNVFDIFSIHISQISNNPIDRFFSMVIFLFRLSVQAFEFASIAFVIRVLYIAGKLKPRRGNNIPTKPVSRGI